jgi:hypothetical protein
MMRMKTLILGKERNHPGVRRSNIGGWNSNDELFA